MEGVIEPESSSSDHPEPEKLASLGIHLASLEIQLSVSKMVAPKYHFHSMHALEFLLETVRILRFNASSFLLITALLVFPVSAVLLSIVLVDQTVVKLLSIRLMLVVKSSGLPLRHSVEDACYKFTEMVVSSSACFPLFATLLLLSKAAVVYSVDCTYSRKKVDVAMLVTIVRRIWMRVVGTYLWSCMVIVISLTLFCVLLVLVCSLFSVLGFLPDLNLYIAVLIGLVFFVIFVNAIVICSIAVVISVLEDVSGPPALLRSSAWIRGQTQVGFLMYLGSTVGMAFVEGLFEHRVKMLSYGDGFSWMWEGPLLVVMYSFVLLMDSVMSTVFYFNCKSYGMESSEGGCKSILETIALADSTGIEMPS